MGMGTAAGHALHPRGQGNAGGTGENASWPARDGLTAGPCPCNRRCFTATWSTVVAHGQQVRAFLPKSDGRSLKRRRHALWRAVIARVSSWVGEVVHGVSNGYANGNPGYFLTCAEDLAH